MASVLRIMQIHNFGLCHVSRIGLQQVSVFGAWVLDIMPEWMVHRLCVHLFPVDWLYASECFSDDPHVTNDLGPTSVLAELCCKA